MPLPARAEVRAFQHAWNRFCHRFGLHYPALTEDGREGDHTKKAIRLSRYFVGVGHHDYRQNGLDITAELLATLHDPFRRLSGYSRADNRARRKTASARRKARVQNWKQHRRPPAPAHGLTMLDGKQCAAWIARILLTARTNRKGERWLGSLISGWRSAAYSVGLCLRMCGRPSCPGRCAGASTNHTGIEFPAGAADCWLATQLRRICAALGLPLHNHLPFDEPHSSYTGY